jgi:hypothetical protein
MKRKRKKKNDSVVFGESSYENKPKNRRQKMNSVRTIEMAISRDNLNSQGQVEQFLQAIGVVRRDEEIIDLELNLPEVIPLKFKIRKEQEVKLTRHNG